ncbi:MAG: signal peptidase II [Anaerolineales bacterium]|nr:signal peptidase II [Anaerolineales bacterium]
MKYIPYLFILLAFFADRLSKWWAAAYLAAYGPTKFNSFFTLQETYNKGVAFGLFQGIGSYVGWLTVGVVVGLLIYMIQLPAEQWLTRIGVAVLIGGALGNLVDRVFVGEVLDFIETPFRQGIFNIADVMIYLGMGLMLLGSIIQRPNRSKTPHL